MRWNKPQSIQSLDDLRPFNARTEPYVCKHLKPRRSKNIGHMLGTLRQDLVSVLRRFLHHRPNLPDELDWYIGMKQVRHGIHENTDWLFPLVGYFERSFIASDYAGPHVPATGLPREAGIFPDAHCLK